MASQDEIAYRFLVVSLMSRVRTGAEELWAQGAVSGQDSGGDVQERAA